MQRLLAGVAELEMNANGNGEAGARLHRRNFFIDDLLLANEFDFFAVDFALTVDEVPDFFNGFVANGFGSGAGR